MAWVAAEKEEFGISRRTAQRWLVDLERFVPIEEWRCGRYR